jgi:hypothetical protein
LLKAAAAEIEESYSKRSVRESCEQHSSDRKGDQYLLGDEEFVPKMTGGQGLLKK